MDTFFCLRCEHELPCSEQSPDDDFCEACALEMARDDAQDEDDGLLLGVPDVAHLDPEQAADFLDSMNLDKLRERVLQGLTDREREVLAARFGIVKR